LILVLLLRSYSVSPNREGTLTLLRRQSASLGLLAHYAADLFIILVAQKGLRAASPLLKLAFDLRHLSCLYLLGARRSVALHAHGAARFHLAELHHALPLDGMIVDEIINHVLPLLILKEVLILLILILIDGLSVSPRLWHSRPDLSWRGHRQSLVDLRRGLGH
jgi:hypothetical protein